MTSKQNNRNESTKKWAEKDKERALKIRRENRRNYVKRHPDRVKETQKYAQIKNLYGLTRYEYEQLLEDYLYKCAICDKENKLTIDHCHASNKIRGILCNKCNAALGMVNDSLEILKAMIAYLEYHREASNQT